MASVLRLRLLTRTIPRRCSQLLPGPGAQVTALQTCSSLLRQRPFSSYSQRITRPPGGKSPLRWPSQATQTRYAHYRYDPRCAREAKPLIGAEHFRKFYIIGILGAGAGTIFYFSNLEEVPVSGRRRFNCYSDTSVESEGRTVYQMTMNQVQGAILPRGDPRVWMVTRVMKNLIPVSGLPDASWEVHVVESDEQNAFVIPGGKVFVFSGILDIAKDDDGLATILGHEIAHNVAKHSAEAMSRTVLWTIPLRGIIIGLAAFLNIDVASSGVDRMLTNLILDFGIMRPGSRVQESEADYIGLMMMARACYDPNAAVGVWQRMEEAHKDRDMPQWLSTHPSNSNRVARMREWLPKAELIRDESSCAATIGYSQAFNKGMQSIRFWA